MVPGQQRLLMRKMSELQPLRWENLAEVVAVHQESLPDDFMTSLGADFLHHAYYGLAIQSGLGFGFFYEDSGRIAGFILGSYEAKTLQRLRLRRYWPMILKSLAKNLLENPFFIKRIFQAVLAMQKRTGGREGAELVSLAVHPSLRRRGIAGKLVQSFKKHLAERGVNHCWTKSHASAAKQFYLRMGFVEAESFRMNDKQYTVFCCDLSGERCG